MMTKRTYRWQPAPWRVGEQKNGAPASAASSPVPPEDGKKKAGTVVLVLVGAAAVAFGVMELLGISKVFAPTPAVPVLPAVVPPVVPPLPK